MGPFSSLIWASHRCSSWRSYGANALISVDEQKHELIVSKGGMFSVAKFVRQCLLCKHFKGPRQIPRPYGPLLKANERNEVVHWDFLSLGESFGDSSYLLVVKDGLSHFCELFPCATPTAYITAEALTLWYARYEMPKTLLSDQGTHFRNETMNHVAARLKVQFTFTPVYSP
ncbi:Retrotransposon protein [Phytophthora megakarya]|uniref:Retrotransposon protein n=1 Tax=Phytophthora megakarya TaxID=4795 RepID=A0A225VM81_9STRA|nr:Retrotransposon protein [Phytophthora megakarya]